MGRIHLVELEDLPWWPRVVRDLATDYLHFMEARFRLHKAVLPILGDALRRTGSDRIVDLCSGGGGPIPALVSDLRRNGVAVSAVLTDRFPNVESFARIAEGAGGAVTFEPEPVDATNVPFCLTGFRTVFNAFHHFEPARATELLADARRAGQPIGVFEIPERSPWMLIALLFTPIYVFLATPFISPLLPRRFLWTYLIPLVPITCWWDGIVSVLRAYEPEELLALTRAVESGYQWRVARVSLDPMPGHLTYLLGSPDPGRS